MRALFRKRQNGERGVAFTELLITMPLLTITMLASVDIGRLIYFNQVATDLSREAANLVSRGATPQATFAATLLADEPLDLVADGGIVISQVRRRDVNDDTPWIFQQDKTGGLEEFASKVGAVNQAANIPYVESLEPGVTIMAVEIVHSFDPIFDLTGFGLALYPNVVYDAAFF